MENRNLSKRVDNFKSSMEDLINELISEIEDLEGDLERANSTISDLEERNTRLEEEVEDLKEDLKNKE